MKINEQVLVGYRTLCDVIPELTLRRPEVTSMSRLSGFSRVQVGKFFELLRYEISRKKYTASQIYNLVQLMPLPPHQLLLQ